MPNNVLNKLIFLDADKETIRKIKEEVMVISDGEETEDCGYGTIDFNRIIPMPEELNIEEGPSIILSVATYLLAACPHTIDAGVEKLSIDDFKKLYAKYGREFISYDVLKTAYETAFQANAAGRNEFLWYGERFCRNYLNYGHIYWYPWRFDKWNTKCNAYDFWTYDPDGLIFCTAWRPPHPIVEELSKRYPSVTIRHEWADEDYGANCGRRVWLNGEIVDRYDPKQFSKRSIAFSRKLWIDDDFE